MNLNIHFNFLKQPLGGFIEYQTILQNSTNQPISSTDFSVASEIINCEKLIENCLQCFITPWYEIKCIICKIGFTTSVKIGNCYPNSLVNSIIVIDGHTEFYDEFFTKPVFYQRAQNYFFTFQYELECKEGYAVDSMLNCMKYCTSECLNCKEDETEFYCAQCPINYYYQPIRSQANGQCIRCPELCEICEERSEAEIQKLNPYFKINNDNRMYTYKCITPIQNQKVVIDPYFLIAKYCFTPSCNSEFTFKQFILEFNSDYKIDIHYCNQIGLQVFNFQTDLQVFNGNLTQLTELKQQIFSLQFLKTEFNLFYNKISYGVISGFDQIEINNVNITNRQIKTALYFQFKNVNQKVNLILKNIVIEKNQISNINSIFDSELFEDITLHNISIMNSNFNTSSLFNFTQKLQQGTIKIQKMILQNCNIFNSQLFQFTNNQVQILIEQLIINQTQFTNSSFISFFMNRKHVGIERNNDKIKTHKQQWSIQRYLWLGALSFLNELLLNGLQFMNSYYPHNPSFFQQLLWFKVDNTNYQIKLSLPKYLDDHK